MARLMTISRVALILVGLTVCISAQKQVELSPDDLFPFTLVQKTTTKAPVFTLPPKFTLTLKPPATTKAPPTTTDAPETTTTAAPTTTTAAPVTTTTAAPTTTQAATTTDAATTTTGSPVTPPPTPTSTPQPPAVPTPPGVTAAPTTPPTPPPVATTLPPPTTTASTSTTTAPPNTNDQVVTAAPTDLTEPPVQTTVTEELALRAAFQVSGSQWATMLEDPPTRSAIAQAVVRDVALLLDVPVGDVILISMYSGSLIASFGVRMRAGRNTQALLNRFAAAGTSTNWLGNTLAEYRLFSLDSVTMLRTGVTYANMPNPSAGSGVDDSSKILMSFVVSAALCLTALAGLGL